MCRNDKKKTLRKIFSVQCQNSSKSLIYILKQTLDDIRIIAYLLTKSFHRLRVTFTVHP